MVPGLDAKAFSAGKSRGWQEPPPGNLLAARQWGLRRGQARGWGPGARTSVDRRLPFVRGGQPRWRGPLTKDRPRADHALASPEMEIGRQANRKGAREVSASRPAGS